MRNYMNPEMNISKFEVTDIVTTSGGTTDPTDPTSNVANAKTYLSGKSISETNILNFVE